MAVHGRCIAHPEYDGTTQLSGWPCAQCSIAWVTAESARYVALEHRAAEGRLRTRSSCLGIWKHLGRMAASLKTLLARTAFARGHIGIRSQLG